MNSLQQMLVAALKWLQKSFGLILLMCLLVFTIVVTSITTGFGLRMAMILNMDESLALALTVGTTIVIAMTLLLGWQKYMRNLRNHGLEWSLAGLPIFLVIVFVGSTWWSVVGMGGGQAFSFGLRDTAVEWEKQIRAEFSKERRELNNLLDVVGSQSAVATQMSTQEINGAFSGLTGTGPLSSGYAVLGATTSSLVLTLESELEALNRSEESAIEIIDTLMATLRSGDDPEDLEVAFLAAQSQIESLTNLSSDSFSPAAIALTLTQAKPTEATIDKASGMQKERLQQLVTSITELQDVLNQHEEARAEAGSVFTLGKITKPSKAVFLYWEDLVGIWGAALVVDFVPLVLLFFSFGSYQRRKKNLPSVIDELHRNETELQDTKLQLDSAQSDLNKAVEEREAEVEAAAKAKSDEFEAELAANKADLEAGLSVVKDNIQQAEADLKNAEQRTEQQERNLLEDRLRMEDDANAQIEAFEEEAREIQSQIDELERKRQGLEDSNPTMLVSRLAATQQRHDDLEQELEKTQQELTQVRTDHREMVDSNIGQQDDIKVLETEIDRLKIELTVLASDLTSERNRLAQTRESLDFRSEQLALLAPEADRAKHLDSELEALTQRFAVSEEHTHHLESTTTNQSVDLDKAHAHIAELERSKAHLIEEQVRLEGIRIELEQQVANLKRHYGTLAASVVAVEAEVGVSNLNELDEVDEAEFERTFDDFNLDDEPPAEDPRQTMSIDLVEDPSHDPDQHHDAMDDLVDAQLTGHPDPDEPSEDPDDEPADIRRTTMVSPGDVPDAESIDTTPDTAPAKKKATRKAPKPKVTVKKK
jgi:hypothetical protein